MNAGAESETAPDPPDDEQVEVDETNEGADIKEETAVVESSSDDDGAVIVGDGLSAGVRYESEERDSLPTPDEYEDAPLVPLDDLDVEPGDFVRYVKEDDIVYQGTVQHGTPVENDFNPYYSQEDDLVVALNFEDGKHVANMDAQTKSRMDVRLAEGRTAQGRGVEPVSPDELVAVSPEDQYDWYKVEEAWDEDSNELLVGSESE